jgi:hypothetical protein
LHSKLFSYQDSKLSRNLNKIKLAPSLLERIRESNFYSYLLENIHLVQLVRNYYIKSQTIGIKDQSETVENTKTTNDTSRLNFGIDLLYRFLELTKQRNSKLYIVTTGFHAIYEKSIDYKFLKKIKFFSKTNNIPFLDLTKSFGRLLKSDYERFTIKDDGHPNELALLTIANYTWPLISQGVCERDGRVDG